MGKSTPKQLCWKAFAEFIRLRDSPGGMGSCISCNKPVAYPNSNGMFHAGHFYPRSVVYNGLYFDEMNVHGQCHFCNTHLEGNTLAYRRGLIHRYGEAVIGQIEEARAAGQGRKWYDDDYKEMAKTYRDKVRLMKRERGIK